MKADLLERLGEVGCDREPFTPDHAGCICRLTGEAADALGVLHAQVKLMRECHDEAEQILRSAMSVAEREGRETNWSAFRGQLRFVLDTYYVARQAFASAERSEPK